MQRREITKGMERHQIYGNETEEMQPLGKNQLIWIDYISNASNQTP